MFELANIDINSVVTTCNSLAEVISSSQGLSALSIILGLSGYSLRDLKGRVNLAKFIEKFKKELPEGTKNETQESILSNSLVELQDYIKNNENLDDNVFEKIGDTIINGIKTEDILTREYIKILKDLSWLDLSVFIETEKIEKRSSGEEVYFPDLEDSADIKDLEEIFIENLKENYNYPKEITKKALKKLNELNLILEYPVSSEEEYSNKTNEWRTDLGNAIFNLLNKK